MTHHADPASKRLRDEKDELCLNLLRGESTQSESITGGCLSRQVGADKTLLVMTADGVRALLEICSRASEVLLKICRRSAEYLQEIC